MSRMRDILRTSGLPASIWHVGLGWLDIATDIAGIVSTINIAAKTGVVCGVDFQRYFFLFFIVQLGLLVGNQVTQMVLAALEANRAVGTGQPGRCRAVCWAMLRGATNCELAYQVFTKGDHVSPQHTLAVLHHKMAELVWEAAQVIMSWTILLIRMIYDEMLIYENLASGVHSQENQITRISYWTRTVQVLSASVGLVSLSISATDFIRIYPLSAWATSEPPKKLFLGLIDVSHTWGVSLATGLYAFVNLLNRSFFYMLVISSFALFSDQYRYAYQTIYRFESG